MPYAIDMHIHADADPRAITGRASEFHEAALKYFGAGRKHQSLDETADLYRGLDMLAVLLAVNSSSGTGICVPNELIAEAQRKHPDVYIGFASVDPWTGRKAIDEVRQAVEELGLKGFKFHPATQNFYANEARFYPIYEAIARYELPMLFHTGTTGIGAGMPGGGGVKLGTCRPVPYLDDVAADFPSVNIILAHPSWPWQDEALAMAMHKPNVFIDLSGWSPRYFSESLIRYANTRIQDKVMFGSDYPLITPERWLRDFDKAGFREEVKPKILFDNANRLLGLELTRSARPDAWPIPA